MRACVCVGECLPFAPGRARVNKLASGDVWPLHIGPREKLRLHVGNVWCVCSVELKHNACACVNGKRSETLFTICRMLCVCFSTSLLVF